MRLGLWSSLRFFSNSQMTSSMKIIQMIKNNEFNNILKHSSEILNLNLASLSYVLTELKKKNLKTDNYNLVLNIIMKSLEKAPFESNLAMSVCSLMGIAKFITFSDVVTKKITDFVKINSNNFTSRGISDIVLGVYHLNISTKEKIEILEVICESIDKNIENLTSKDRVSIITGFCKIISPKIQGTAKNIIQKIDQQNIQEMSALCNFLSFCPFKEFMYMFQVCEDLVLKNSEDISLVKNQLVHAFSKTKKGTSRIWIFFLEQFLNIRGKLDPKTLSVWYKALYKSKSLPLIKINQLNEIYEIDKKRIPSEHLEQLAYYKGLKPNSHVLSPKDNNSDK